MNKVLFLLAGLLISHYSLAAQFVNVASFQVPQTDDDGVPVPNGVSILKGGEETKEGNIVFGSWGMNTKVFSVTQKGQLVWQKAGERLMVRPTILSNGNIVLASPFLLRLIDGLGNTVKEHEFEGSFQVVGTADEVSSNEFAVTATKSLDGDDPFADSTKILRFNSTTGELVESYRHIGVADEFSYTFKNSEDSKGYVNVGHNIINFFAADFSLLKQIRLSSNTPTCVSGVASSWLGPNKGFMYLDHCTSVVSILDAAFNEVRQVPMPKGTTIYPEDPYVLTQQGNFYFGTERGVLYKIEADHSIREFFRVPSGLPIRMSPIELTDGVVIFGSVDGKIYAVDRTGNTKATFETQGWVTGRPLLLKSGLIAAPSHDGYMYILRYEP